MVVRVSVLLLHKQSQHDVVVEHENNTNTTHVGSLGYPNRKRSAPLLLWCQIETKSRAGILDAAASVLLPSEAFENPK